MCCIYNITYVLYIIHMFLLDVCNVANTSASLWYDHIHIQCDSLSVITQLIMQMAHSIYNCLGSLMGLLYVASVLTRAPPWSMHATSKSTALYAIVGAHSRCRRQSHYGTLSYTTTGTCMHVVCTRVRTNVLRHMHVLYNSVWYAYTPIEPSISII